MKETVVSQKKVSIENDKFPITGTLFYICLKITKLRIIAKKILREFWEKYPDCEQQLKSWYRETEKSSWKSINEIKIEYPSASILKENRIIFNIKGNKYRLIVKINFHYQMVWVRFIGTHQQYDNIDANKI
jgi:mRNA interferase HigB